MPDLTRRSLATGAAWSIPAVTVAASAPAEAVSTTTPPSIKRSFLITRSNAACSSGAQLTVRSNNDGTSYYQIQNTTAKTTVTQVFASVLVSVSGLKFTTSTGNWSSVQQDLQTYKENGVTYYRYYSSLTVPVPASVNGTITIPRLSWSSNCTSALSSTVYVNGRGTATIDGTQQVQVGVFRTV